MDREDKITSSRRVQITRFQYPSEYGQPQKGSKVLDHSTGEDLTARCAWVMFYPDDPIVKIVDPDCEEKYEICKLVRVDFEWSDYR